MGELPPRPEHLGAQIRHPALHRQGGNDDDDHPGETFSVAVLRAGSVPPGSRGPRPALLRLRVRPRRGQPQRDQRLRLREGRRLEAQGETRVHSCEARSVI